ncbi:MAG: host attachment protein [Asticcacaulis sp.]|uniref:host attachment protein n=1 Tax=Asticcacaulis sp. TaxID=1872648 RepID=UPI003F7B55B0
MPSEAPSHLPLPHERRRRWVLVADAASAQIYRLTTGLAVRGSANRPEAEAEWRLEPLPDLNLTPETIEAYEMGAATAMTFGAKGRARHATEPRPNLRRRLKADLARAVAERLNEACLKDRFDDLIVVAPPAWLGDLRAGLSDPARGLVRLEIGRDYAGLDLPELTRKLQALLPDLDGPGAPF